jgi:hypothetical protein
MTITYRGGGKNANTAASSVVVTMDVNAQQGDLLVAFQNWDTSTGTPTWPTGSWTAGDSLVSTADGGTAIWAWRLAGAGEPSTYTVGNSNTGYIAAAVVAYAPTSSSYTLSMDVTPTKLKTSGTLSPWNCTAPGLASGTVNRMMVHLGAADPTSAGTIVSAPPSGWTERQDQSSIQWVNVAVSDYLDTTGTLTADVTSILTQGTDAGDVMAFLLAIKEVLAAGGSGVHHAITHRNAMANLLNTELGTSPLLVLRGNGTADSPGVEIATLTMNSTAFNSAVNGVATAFNITTNNSVTGNAAGPTTVTLQTSANAVKLHFAIDTIDATLTGGAIIAPGDTVSCPSLTYTAPP